MSMKQKKLSAGLALLPVLVLTGNPYALRAEPSGNMPESVTVSGLVEKPFTVTPASVRKRAVAERQNTPIVCDSGETRKILKTYRGVLLRDILDSARVTVANPGSVGSITSLSVQPTTTTSFLPTMNFGTVRPERTPGSYSRKTESRSGKTASSSCCAQATGLQGLAM
jgi:hypothetical protein